MAVDSRSDGRRLSSLAFALFSAWLLAIPFEGQVLYALARTYDFDLQWIIVGTVSTQFIGLACGGLVVRSIVSARRVLQISPLICLLASTVLFFPPSVLWNIALIISAFLASLVIVSWGWYYKSCTPSQERLKTAAEVLILSNILMTLMNVAGTFISAQVGLALCMMMLGAAFFLSLRLPVSPADFVQPQGQGHMSIFKLLAFLCLFIVIITVISGLMYQVLIPAYAHHQWLVTWYWAVPYIIALYIMQKLPRKTNRTYILYVAIAMIGFAFISFMTMDCSTSSYLVVNTMMMGACGVYDLFWWSILGEMLDYHRNPSWILGIGLSANVLGVLLGKFAGNAITEFGMPRYNPSVLALVMIFVILIILPPLHRYLSLLLKKHAFLTTFSEMTQDEQLDAADNIIANGQLTDREGEIANLLLKGKTYKMVASELFLSENTVKTHIKNIYSKLNIRSRMELVNLMIENDYPLPK